MTPALPGRKAQRATQVRMARKVLPERLAQMQRLPERQVKRDRRGLPELTARPARAPTLPLKLVVTRAHRPIFTLILPLCRGLRRRLRRFKEVES